MKKLSKIKQKLRASKSADRESSQPASVPSAASTSQITTPSCHQSTTSSLTVPVMGSPSIISPSTATTQQETISPPSPEPENAAPSVPDRLWNKAYDILEEKEPEIVKSYQEILQLVQHEWADITAPEELQALEHCKTVKSRQMWRLVYSGLEKSKRQAKLKENVSNIIETIENLKGVVDKAVKYSSEAAIAWAGVTLGLEILSNPMKEPGLNRKGIAYVLSRMEWYWNLVELVLQDNSSAPSATLRTNLETQIIDFYKKLLLFQMKSACLYYRNWAGVILRDAVKLDDWAGELNTIKDAERLIRKDIEQYDNHDIRLKLGTIETSAVGQAESLETICKILREEARLKEKNAQDDKDEDCLAALLVTDPRMDKKRIQTQKGDPLKESYEWILKSGAYQRFMDDASSQVLWINGPPGKGKTMLLCGIVDELQKSLRPISFFFCQANVKEEDLSSDIAVMRGLIYVLLEHQPSLISLIRPSYDKQKGRLFNSINSSELLGDILTTMLQDPSLHDAILLVDALDECNIHRSKLTTLIVRLSKCCNAKWIVSSRGWPDIYQEIADATGLISLDLEAQRESVSQAVKSYISKKVDDLAKTKWTNDLELKGKVFDYMQSHADDTFLWVALVCERLANSGIRKRLVMEELVKFPTSLGALYQAMLDRITNSSEAHRLKQILSLVCVVYRPLKSAEIPKLVESMDDYDENDVEDAIASCGSFLILQDGEIFFVHQSAKEFLLDRAHDDLFPRGINHKHAHIFSRSLEAMENTLRQDIYELGSPGTLNPVEAPSPDPLACIKYSCVYWVQHLCIMDPIKELSLSNFKRVLHFLQMKLTFWLEALSLIDGLSTSVTSIMALETTLENVQMSELTVFVRDARRFIAHHKPAMESAPLQVYCSALMFCPKSSFIRQHFSNQIPKWVIVDPGIDDDWDAHMQTIYIDTGECHASYSPDGRSLACSIWGTTRVYETASGKLIHKVLASSDFARPVYSPDALLLSCGFNHGIAIVDATTFEVKRNIEIKADRCFFLPKGNSIVVVFEEHVTVLDWETGECFSKFSLNNESNDITVLSATHIVTVSLDASEVKIWDLATGDCKHTFNLEGEGFGFVACSSDGHWIAAASGLIVRLWYLDATLGWVYKHDLSFEYVVDCLTFSADSRTLISGSCDNLIRIWDETGVCIRVLKAHTQRISFLTVCQMRNQLASGSQDGIIKLWDLSHILSEQFGQKRPPSVQKYDDLSQPSESSTSSDKDIRIYSLFFSPTGKTLVSISDEETHIWDTAKDSCTDIIISGGGSGLGGVSFTSDGKLVAMKDTGGKLGVWDTEVMKQVHFSDIERPDYVAISADGRYVLSLSQFSTEGEHVLKVWDLIKDPQSQQHIISKILPLERDWVVTDFVYSEDGKVLAVLDIKGLHVLHRKSGNWVEEQLRHRFYEIPLAFSPDGKWLLTLDSYLTNFPTSIVKDLRPLKAVATARDTPQGEKPCCRIATRYGLLAVGERTAHIGWGLSLGMDWIMRGNERMLWIPAEYRRMALDVNASRVAFVCPSGQIKIMRFRQESGAGRSR